MIGGSGVLVNQFLPICIIVIQIVVTWIIRILHEREIVIKVLRVLRNSHSHICQILFVVIQSHHRHPLIIPVDSVWSIIAYSRLQVIGCRTVCFDQDYTIGAHWTIHGRLSTFQYSDILYILQMIKLEDIACKAINQCRRCFIGHVGHTVYHNQRSVITSQCADPSQVIITAFSRHTTTAFHL